MPSLFTHFAHLGRGASATAEPEFDGMDWYAAYGERHAADGTGEAAALFITPGLDTDHRPR